MRYTISIGGGEEIAVDSLQYGVSSEGTVEGWGEVFIRVVDSEMDIYTDSAKRVWIEWVDANCGEKNNPEKRIKHVVARICGDDGTPYRKIEIENAYLDLYLERAVMKEKPRFEAVIRRANTRQGNVTLSTGS